MPSPIIHATVGYVVYRWYRSRHPEDQDKNEHILPLATVTASLLPDADFIPGLIHGQVSQFHNQATHSLFAGICIAVFTGLGARLFVQEFRNWMIPILIAFESHVILDFLSGGRRGMMLLWPFSVERYKFPWKLFYGVRWDRGPASPSHLRTIVTEMAIVIGFLLVFRAFRRWRQEP